MTKSASIRGNKLALKFGSGIEAKDYWADLSSVVMSNEDSDDTQTYYDAYMGGAKQWFFEISAMSSTQKTSFWRYVWDNTGEEVAFTFAPHRNEVATEDQPHFIGFVKIPAKPALGGEQSVKGSYSFETRFDIVGEPTLDAGVGE